MRATFALIIGAMVLACSSGSAGEFVLTVGTSGPGKVNVSPAGLACPACAPGQYHYKAGTTVTLSAVPDAGATLSGWSGSCSGTDACSLRLDGDRMAIAAFARNVSALGVQLSGDGMGGVTSDPAGIDCGGLCLADFPAGTSVTLTAVAAQGSVFLGWSGACQGSGPCTVQADRAHSVSALFTRATGVLLVQRAGPGTVLSSPNGIACGVACTAEFGQGARVTLSAVPEADAVFTGWSGECTGTGACVVTIGAASSVQAQFSRPQHTVTVNTSGTGFGTAFSSPIGISCGASCAASFDQGTTVVLAAAPNPGSLFLGWTGACAGLNTCLLSIDADKAVTAQFGLAPPGVPQNPAPVLLSVTPNTALAGTTGLILTLQGQNFVDTSVAYWFGQVRATTFVDSRTLQMALLDSDLANPSGYNSFQAIQVGTPVPGGGLSATLSFTVTVPRPTLTLLDPPSAVLNAAPFQLRVVGTGFLSGSTVMFNSGYPAGATTYVSPTELLVGVSANVLQNAQAISVSVNSPSFVTSTNSLTFTVQNPVPQATSVTPASVPAGSGDAVVTLYGSGFANSFIYPYTSRSVVRWNGTELTTTFLTGGELRATIPAVRLASAGSGQLTVFTQGPGGGESAPLTFAIPARPPQITGSDPPSVAAGAAAFTLTLLGTGFTPGSAVTWNGAPRAVTFVSATSLQVSVGAPDVAAVGSASIAVSDPSVPGTAPALGFPVLAASPAVTSTQAITVTANDLAWDATRRRFYASVPSTAPAWPNALVIVDADTAAVVGSIRVGSEPGRLSLSTDASKLYVALAGAAFAQRIDLAAGQVDLDVPLAGSAIDVQAVPGAAGSVAIAFSPSPYGSATVGIFDEALQRPEVVTGFGSFDRLSFSAPDMLLASSPYSALTRAQVLPTGVFSPGTYTTYPSPTTDVRTESGRVYLSTGAVLDAMGARVGTFALPTTGSSFWVTPDAAHGRVFFLGGTTLLAYDPSTFVKQGSLTLTDSAAQGRFVRWDADGIAYRTSTQVILVRSSLVGG